MLRFLIDENLPGKLAEDLGAAGFSAECVSDNKSLRTMPDETLMEYAVLHGLIVVSKDKDFADFTRFPPGTHPGVVCVRLPNKLGIDEQCRIVVAAIEAIDAGELPGSLLTVEAGRVRLRRA